jgi:tRNA A-37 threonylcarbamoyl transferase component Bud32
MGSEGEGGAAALPTGALVGGRYRVEARIGRGATSDVYAVRDEQLGRALALKYLRPIEDRAADATRTLQLEREYFTLCELAHPSIIAVYDYSAGEHTFYTMELLEGRDIAQLGVQPWRQACAILRDIASSLAIVHSRRLLHRDISARNVYRTKDGRAKLIDFGALTPMGVVKQIVGTPPFVPPEALALQPLDARADLYAFGALAYYLLTGEHAYRARSFEQLPDLWRSPITSVRAPRAGADPQDQIPEALEQLVLELLSLDRNARPSSAAEVMERICGIAGLPLIEQPEVGHAYLTTPTLIGREEQLTRVRKSLIGLHRGRGALLVIEGAPGSGRSRFLDACVLEAKLLGATVLRADAHDAGGAPLGVVRALCEQLVSAVPGLARAHARPHASRLGHFCPGLVEESGLTETAPSSRKVHAALRDFFMSLARSHRVVIAIDDFEKIDEASAALLGALASKLSVSTRNLVLIAASEQGGEHGPALALIRSIADNVELPPLDADQTEAVLRVVFGDVQHVAAIAARLHEVAGGNARATMALAEHLVQRGIARYEAGGWLLPLGLTTRDLPDSITATLRARLSALPPDARELADVLALTDESAVPIERYVALCEHKDPARAYRALDGLIAARILVPSGDRHRFAQRELSAVLEAALSQEHARRLHERLARSFTGTDHIFLLSKHLWLAGRERDAIHTLLSIRGERTEKQRSQVLELLEQFLLAEQRLELSPRTAGELSLWLVDIAASNGDLERCSKYGDPLIGRLVVQSGLAAYHAATDQPHSARLGYALAHAHAIYDATPEAARGFTPFEAIAMLARACAMYAGMASSLLQDRDLFDRLPSLDPLASLSPALTVVRDLIAALTEFQSGRYDDAGHKSLSVIERVSQPDGAGLEGLSRRSIYLGQLYMQGVLAAARGQATTPAWIAELEQDPLHRVNAWRVRMTHDLMQGDLEAARISQRNAELLQLQDGGHVLYPGSTTRIELLAYVYASDVVGVKQVLTRLETLAARYPRFQQLATCARARYRSLQGDHKGALEELSPALDMVPGRHVDWGIAAATHVNLMMLAGRADEAAELGLQHIATCLRERLSPTHRSMSRVTAEAMIAAGRWDEARELATALVEESEREGVQGVNLALAYEVLAMVGMHQGDSELFEHAAARWNRESKRYPALRARYERLLREAVQRGVREAPSSLAPDPDHDRSLGALQLRLAGCLDRSERAHAVLFALVDALHARGGFLFGLQSGTLEVIAHCASVQGETASRGTAHNAAPWPQPSLRIRALAAAALADALDTHSAATLSAEALETLEPGALAARTDSLMAFVLGGAQAGDRAVAAIAVVMLDPKASAQGHPNAEPSSQPPTGLLELLGSTLLDQDDVDPVTRVA